MSPKLPTPAPILFEQLQARIDTPSVKRFQNSNLGKPTDQIVWRDRLWQATNAISTTTVSFTNGFVAGAIESFSLNAINDNYWYKENASAYYLGKTISGTVSAVAGVVTTNGGAVLAATTGWTGVGAAAGATVSVYGAGVAASGAVTAAESSYMFAERSKNKLQSDSNAQGDHSTFKQDPNTGEVTNYNTYKENPQNPNGYDMDKRYDGTGAAHRNKVTGENVETPHVHDPNTPGGVRVPEPWEIPKSPNK